MKVNKRALYALAAYYEACGNESVAKPAERKMLADLVVLCIDDSFDEKELYRSFQHGEVFFKAVAYDACESAMKYQEVYLHKFNDKNIAKLLRYIAREGKFPRAKSLKYIV